MVLHCIRSQASSIVVASHGTDIPVLLLAHFSKMSCPKIWMKSCTSKKHRYIPIHLVTAKFDNCVLSILPAFHSLTGSDTIHKFILSFFLGWSHQEILLEHLHRTLQPSATLDKGVFSEYASTNAENFICKVYKATTVSADSDRSNLFAQGHPLEMLPQRTMPYPFTSSGHTSKHQCEKSYRLTSSVLYYLQQTMGWRIESDALVGLPIFFISVIHA